MNLVKKQVLLVATIFFFFLLADDSTNSYSQKALLVKPVKALKMFSVPLKPGGIWDDKERLL
jgi:hypothetical protein